MKKHIIIAIVLALVILLPSCKANNPVIEDKNIDSKAKVETEKQTKPEEKTDDGVKMLAYQGKVDNVQVGIGGSMQDAIKELGAPIEIGHFEGSSFLSYANLVFMLDGIVEDMNGNAQINGIVASEGYELYGVRVGMTMIEIKQVLGAPQQEYKEGEDEGDIWKLQYEYGDYKVIFYFDEKTGPSTSAYLSRI